MEFNSFKYSKDKGTYKALINTYNYNGEVDVLIRSDYTIVITDDVLEETIKIPERIKIIEIKVHYVTDHILMIELVLQDLNIDIRWV